MNRDVRVSVAMATYNGEKYIKKQIETIIKNLEKNDELVISDDGSKDKTRHIIKKIIEKDDRIKLIEGPNKGVKQNFENAIKNCKGKYIFLSDQDDLWEKDKVQKVLKCFEKHNCSLVIHDAKVIDENENEIIKSFFEFRNSGAGIIKNIWKNTYIGCCMAFKGEIKEKVLPIPDNIEMHDQWIGIINEKYGKSEFLKDKLIKYRRHSGNVSTMKHYGIFKMIKNRAILIANYLYRIK